MIKAVIFNWSGTLSDYGGRGRQAWYNAAGQKPAQLARYWPHYCKTITTFNPGVLSLLKFLKLNHIPTATVTQESSLVLADLVNTLATYHLMPAVNVAEASASAALQRALWQLDVRDDSQVLGVFDATDWLQAAKNAHLNTVGLVIGSRMIGLSTVAWKNLAVAEQKHGIQRIRTAFTQLGVENTLANAQSLQQLIQQLKPLEVRR
jgi:beta-phosphoglucomutase-like phosphatase (HAD superfamily)